jgi:hypothetical protein
MAEQMSSIVVDVLQALGSTKRHAVGFCSDSPNVMTLTRRMMTGQVSEIESCVLFAYACSCHALANLAKDLCAAPDVKDTGGKSMQAATLFRNTAIARHMLEEWQRVSNREPRPRSIKSFSPTRWNSISELLSSLACNQDGIVTILTNQKMAVGNDRRLDFEMSSSKASVVPLLHWKGHFGRA